MKDPLADSLSSSAKASGSSRPMTNIAALKGKISSQRLFDREIPHRILIVGGHVGQAHRLIDSQALAARVSAE